ncbi:hypothetical protein Lser_V15G29647 [Lactuca serriola]
MGGVQTKGGHHANNGCEVRILREKTKLLQQKLEEVISLRGTENEVYEQEMMVHALKESEWKQERKWLQREVKRLKKVMEEKEEKHRRRETSMMEKKSEKMALQELQTDMVLEQMKEERERRDEAVEKWKRLYLAIKIELDNLINTTHQGKTTSWREDDDYVIHELQKELRAKEETIELLQAHIASIEQEESRRERELDILRQSLRIMNHRKKPKHISKEIYNTKIKLNV